MGKTERLELTQTNNFASIVKSELIREQSREYEELPGETEVH